MTQQYATLEAIRWKGTGLWVWVGVTRGVRFAIQFESQKGSWKTKAEALQAGREVIHLFGWKVGDAEKAT